MGQPCEKGLRRDLARVSQRHHLNATQLSAGPHQHDETSTDEIRNADMFLIRPVPLPGESLSSWRKRAGWLNGLSRIPRPPRIHVYPDPDHLPSDREMEWLESEFRMSTGAIFELTLAFALSSMGSNLPRRQNRHWILPHVGGRFDKGRPMFCPLCLATDPVPYFRTRWRLAMNTHCEIHACLLEQECPSCRLAVWPATAYTIERFSGLPLNFCHMCGELLSNLTPRLLSERENKVEQETLQNVCIDMLGYVIQVITKSKYDLMHYISRVMRTNEPWINGIRMNKRSVKSRIPIIAAASWVLGEWPDRFVTMSQSYPISRGAFSDFIHLAPASMKTEIMQHLGQRPHDSSNLMSPEVLL